MSKDYRVEADYYYYGIELGILSFEQAISWANKIIEMEDEPDPAIIEVALSRLRGRDGVMESLKEVKGSYRPQTAGAKLLVDLYRFLKEGDNINSLSSKAQDVAMVTQMSQEIQRKFTRINDDVFLAEEGKYADIEQCKIEFECLLEQYQYNEKLIKDIN